MKMKKLNYFIAEFFLLLATTASAAEEWKIVPSPDLYPESPGYNTLVGIKAFPQDKAVAVGYASDTFNQKSEQTLTMSYDGSQ